jgi:hypothetical protein
MQQHEAFLSPPDCVRVLRERGAGQREHQSQRQRRDTLSKTFHFHFS